MDENRYIKFLQLIIAASLLLLVGACGEFTNNKEDDEPLDKYEFIRRHDARQYADRSERGEELVSPVDSIDPSEFHEQVSNLLQGSKKSGKDQRLRRKVPPFYEDFILIDADEEVDVMLVFNSVQLVDTLPAFADVLGFNFTADSELKNTVTLNLNSIMTRRELWETFDEMLKLAGAGVVKNGQLLQIMPAAKMPSMPSLRVRNRFDGSSEVISYALINSNAKEIAAQIKPFLSKEGVLVELTRQNVLLISDNSANIPKLKQILDVVDQPGRTRWPRLVIYCNNVKPSKIATELSEILPVIGLPVITDLNRAEDPGAIRLNSVDRLQLIVATAPNEESLEEIQKWIKILDNSDSADQERAYIYKVAHGKASELAQALSVIFTTQGSTLTVDTSAATTRTEQITTQRTQTATQTPQGTSSTSAILNRNSTNNLLNTQIDRESGVFDTPVRVFADGSSNRLIIRTTPRTYAMIKALLDRLDVVPAQILMQALIVEVNLNKSNEFGIEFNTIGQSGNVGTDVGTNYNNLDPNNKSAEGFKFGIFNPKNPDEKFGFLRALAGREKLKIISSPQLVVTSNTEAYITVGQDVPILTQDITNNNSEGNVTRAYTYRQVGIILTITPQITSTDLISLDLVQEVSEAIPNVITSASDTPVINIREIKTSMTVANGRTMIIGGMIQEKLDDDMKSVPILADIPVVNRLVGSTAISTKRTELLVLITCYIINEKSPVEDMVKRYNESVKTLARFEQDIETREEQDRERAAEVLKAMNEEDPVVERNDQ